MKLKLQELRLARGMTQAEVAEKLGISKSAIGMYEQGRREPDLETVIKLAEFFSVSVEEMLGLREAGKPIELMTALRRYLAGQPGISFQGKQLTEEEIDKLTHAIEISAAIALKEEDN